MKAGTTNFRSLLKQALSFALAFAIWFSPIPAGLTKEAWHLFAIFAAAIFAVILNSFPLLPASPSNTARGGVLYPIILSLAQNSGSKPDDGKNRRMGGYLMFCGMASLSVSSALWLTATSGNPIAVTLAEQYGVKINFGSWIIAASIPVLAMIALLPLLLYKLFPPGVTKTPDAPKAARDALSTMGPLTRDEWIVAVAFAFMVTGWAMAGPLNLSLAAVAFAGLGALLATNVLSLEDK